MTDPRPWVLFDLDDTLLDYERSEAAAVVAAVEDVGLDADADVVATYREITAHHWRLREAGETTPQRLRVERWRDVLDALGVTTVVDLEALSARYVTHLAAGAHLIPGAREVVVELARTHGIAYVTNGLSDVQRPRLAASGLDVLAEAVLISDEVGVAKPSPAIFDAALVAMGEPQRDRVTVVGDSLTADVAGAAAAGLRSVWYAPQQPPAPAAAPRPDHHRGDLRDLPALLAR